MTRPAPMDRLAKRIFKDLADVERLFVVPSAADIGPALLSSEAEHEAFVAAEKAIAKPAKKRGRK